MEHGTKSMRGPDPGPAACRGTHIRVPHPGGATPRLTGDGLTRAPLWPCRPGDAWTRALLPVRTRLVPVARGRGRLLLACALFGAVAALLCPGPAILAQQSSPAPAANPAPPAVLEQRLQAVTALLDQTRQTLSNSLAQLDRLQREVDQLRAEAVSSERPAASTIASACPAQPQAAPAGPDPANTAPSPGSPQNQLDAIAEEQEILRAEVQQHDQTKLESGSKYPVRVDGLVLFNAFSNSGPVDQIDLPSIALPRSLSPVYGASGSAGASLRQTVLGLEATGPTLWGARSAASLNIDFFGGIANSSYNSPATSVRLRLAQFGLFWTPPRSRVSVEAGIDGPLISPLSPTSYATVAVPSMAWAGNLWTWSPQLRVRYSRALGALETSGPRLGFEAGLLDPQVTGLDNTAVQRVASPGELSRQPALEARAFFETGPAGRPLILGAGVYRSRQTYSSPSPYADSIATTSWAATSDWKLPLGRWLTLTGEAYRGSGLGSLGGGAYKDVLTGTDPRTGYARTEELDAAGGWAQLKVTLGEQLEANAAWGLDDAFAGAFHSLSLAPSNDPLQLAARDSMTVGNLIYRPKTYLLVSPEYRRIASWQITGAPSLANIFTLSMGYQF